MLVNVSACNYSHYENVTENTADTGLDILESNIENPDNKVDTVYFEKNISFENYESIVSAYRLIVALCPQYGETLTDDYFVFLNEEDEDKDLYEKLYCSTLTLYPRDNNGINGNCYDRFGYTIKDLNQDGVNELILRLDNHETIAIFTMVDKKPILLDYYWNRRNCWIDPDGYLHVSGSSGADKSVSQIYCISDKTSELILVEEGGTAGHDETSGNTLYYKLVNNEKVHITKEEYNSWQQSLTYKKLEVAETISEYMPFIFLFNEDHPAPEPYVPQAKG